MELLPDRYPLAPRNWVMKFGGTSVGGAPAVAQAAAIVQDQAQAWKHLVVIVSAMRGVTDALIQGARTAVSSDG